MTTTANTNTQDNVALLLQQQGVTKAIAEELVRTYSADHIRSQIRMLSFRNPQNPAGMLVQAIRQNWVAPPEYLQYQEQVSACRVQERRRLEEKQKKRTRYRAIRKARERMSEEERQQVRQEAIERVAPLLRQHYGDENLPEVLVESFVNQIVTERCLGEENPVSA